MAFHARRILEAWVPSILALLLLFLSSACFADWTGRCVGVADGDTISVMRDGVAVRIRLEGIDCPESKQAFGGKAKEFTSSMAFGKEVEVREKCLDRYGRTVGRVFIEGKDLSLELVKSGFAWHYKKYSEEQALADAEYEAKMGRIGLWADSDPIPPWEFRQHRREESTKLAAPLL